MDVSFSVPGKSKSPLRAQSDVAKSKMGYEVMLSWKPCPVG